MSRASDVAIVRSARTGRMNFVWQQADLMFDETREHEVLSRLVERRGAWWGDTTRTHGSRNHEIKLRTASTSSDAQASAREALAGMVLQADIALHQVRVELPEAARGQFSQSVFYGVPGKPKTFEVTTQAVAPCEAYAAANPGQWGAPTPTTQCMAIDRLAWVVYHNLLDGSPIPLAGAVAWSGSPPASVSAEIDRLATALYTYALDSTPIPLAGVVDWQGFAPATDQDRLDRLATQIYVRVFDSNPIP